MATSRSDWLERIGTAIALQQRVPLDDVRYCERFEHTAEGWRRADSWQVRKMGSWDDVTPPNPWRDSTFAAPQK